MKTIFSYHTRIAFLAAFFCLTIARAETVNREPPPIYGEVLEKELTPLDPLLDQVGYFTPEESDHGCVLQETVAYVDDTGRTYEVFHHAYKALSNGDLDDIGSDLYTYRPETDQIYLIKAETILPDGTVCAVPPEGIMFQAHQQEQDSMIFSGRKQLRIIYPQVSMGSVTHCIVLVEHESSRIPDRYTDRFTWERSWQTQVKRAVVSLPEAYAKNLNIVVLGDGVPVPEKTVLDSGRVRYEWVRKKLPVRSWEYLDGPVIQTGPALFLSTLQGWDDMARWYAERIRESSVATDAVKTVAQEWAGEAKTGDEIIHNLAFRVANDIRYVSLEFGVGGLQPQPVANVLENRFGDCKDKANFLRVLLKENGIKSHVALINTKHAGRVEQRCVDYSYFNHAILLIEKPDGEEVFCDPTVKYGSAGLLYPSIANRPALIIDEENSTSRWVQTPQVSAGNLDYGLDLKLSETGELSGWITVKAHGYYATSLSRRFEATDRDSLKYEVEKYVGYFYDASSVIDFELERARPDAQAFLLKAYLIKPPTGQAKLSVSWPSIKWVLPRLGEDKDVEREAFIWNDVVRLALKIELPESMTSAGKPNDWSVQAPGFEAAGKWSIQQNVLAAEFSAEVSKTHIPPPEFPRLFNAVDATCHWLEEPVILGAAEGAVAEKAAELPAGQLGEEFVMMSTGKGQVDLVDHLYPSDTRAEERRLALVKTKAWFPKDAKTQFECDVRLGWLAYGDEEYQESLELARKALREYGDAVDLPSRGWASYLEAMSLEDVDQVDESLKLFAELEANPEMNEYRRGYAAYQYARIMSDKDGEQALAYYLKALGYKTYNEEWMLGNCYQFLLKQMLDDEFVGFLEEMHGVEPERAKSVATWLAGLAIENKGYLNGLTEAAKIYTILSGLDFAETGLDAQQLAQLETLNRNYEGYVRGREALKKHLAENTYGFWSGEPDRKRSFEEYKKDIEEAINDDEIEQSTRLGLWRILELKPEVEFAEWVWDASRMVDYLYKHDQRDLEPLLTFIFDMRQYLPKDETGTIDLQFMQSESLEREGHVDEALAVYQSLHDQELDDQWWDSLYMRWTELLISSGHADQAVEVCSFIKAHLKDDEDYLPICMQGIFTLLEAGKLDEALVWIHEIYEISSVLGWENESVERLSAWVDLDDAGLLEEFWTLQEKWGPGWVLAASAAGLPTNEVARLATFSELEDAGRKVGEAIARKDAADVALKIGQMLLGARWHPYLCVEMQSLMAHLVTQYPDAGDEFYQLEVELNAEAFQLDPTNRFSCRINTLDGLLKLERYDELMELAESYFNDPVKEGDLDMYSRYGALAAINLSQAGTAWVGRMEQQLQNSDYQNDPYAVNILSLLYRLENRAAEEQELLRRFAAEYSGDNEQMLGMLKTRLQQSQELSEGNRKLTEALNDWVGKHGPVWLAFFPDSGLEQEDISGITRRVTELSEQQDDQKYHEAVYLLRAALDERLDSSTRENAFSEFLGSNLGPLWDTSRNVEMLGSVAGDARFSDALRSFCANFAANLAASTHMPGYIEKDLLPAVAGLEIQEELDKQRDRLVRLSDLDAFSAEAIALWMDSVRDSGKAVDHRSVFLLGAAFSDLCRLGAVELAQQQILKAKKMRFESGVGSSSFALQLEWQQQLDWMKAMIPLHQIMQEELSGMLNPSCERPKYVDVALTRTTDLAALRTHARSLLQYGLYDHTSMAFWGELNDAEYLNGNILFDAKNLDPLMEKVLAACETDSQYGEAVMMLMQLFDSDDPECQRIFAARTEALMRKPGLRKTQQMLLWRHYRERIRAGDYQRALADLQTEQNLPKTQRHALLMNLMLASEDQAALSEYLNTASPDLLLADDQLADTLQAYRICGRDSAFALLKEKGEEELREFMTISVTADERRAMQYAVQLAGLLDAESCLEGEWADQVRHTATSDHIAFVEMYLGSFKEDWQAVEVAARRLVGYAPLHYDTYFFLGKALIRQEKYAEGIQALDPFLRYCKDSPDYTEARTLADEAKSKI